MTLDELLIVGKESKTLCEDAFFFNDHFACIVDGATRQTDYRYEGNMTPGKIASILVVEAFKHLDYHSSLAQIVDSLSDYFLKYYSGLDDMCFYQKNKDVRACASVIIYSTFHRKIWMIGDCQCLLNDEPIVNRKHVDIIAAEIRSIYLSMELAMGKTVDQLLHDDTGRKYILPILTNQVVFQNDRRYPDYSYAVIDGFPVDMLSVKEVDVPRNSHVVLASDGYPLLFKTLNETEAYLKHVLSIDPLLILSSKSTRGSLLGLNAYDDRAYLSFFD